MTGPAMRMLACGDAAVLVEVDDLDTVLRLAVAVAEARDRPTPGRRIDGVIDVVPAARTLLLRCRPGTDLPRLSRTVRSLPLPAHLPADADEVRLPVVYDGDDLADVAALTGLSVDEVVARHQATEWRVAFTGFAPGFGYLVGGDGSLHVPRREESRPKVPAGAVGLAGEYSGVYPRASPGGWQLIGRTDAVLWDADRSTPALLGPGTRVRFTAVDR